MKYLLDTNVLLEPVKPTADVNVLKHLVLFEHEIATAAPVLHELQYGVRRLAESAKRRTLEAYLKEVVLPNIPILPYDQRAAVWHADQRARLAINGRPLAFVDGQIAAIARVNGLVLVTRNVADFLGFQDLEVENWHDDL
ncbi:MAG TPA: type II toxin-antitoxin system VapC family toxin [Desulfobacteraceae bacterium]|nr:type II toxin-antitoxin system VapC family toxin [Deltaproteobacteria bacterium]RLB99254.1 MAG: VapC toxin family PIN domain ribonuclease [Deltaproteobacteria bacterium]HDI58872.1 type II toxin-antitoxin system VapC family toxin [Desulfobacteraceae bacterium]